jgi:drug/metabolite transporter (DMT)-like permease
MLFYSELIKCSVSTLLGIGSLKTTFTNIRPLLLPCVCFIVMNVISNWCVARIPATLYVILSQIKLPFTLICSVVVTKQTVEFPKVCGVLLMFIASANIIHNEHAHQKMYNKYFGMLEICGIFLEAVLSACVNIYMQRLFKDEKTNIWIRNIEMSLVSLLVYTSYLIYNKESLAVPYMSMLFSILCASGGILVAIALKQSTAISKTLFTSLSIVMVTCIEHWFYQRTPSFTLISFIFVAFMSMALYTYVNTDEKSTIERDSLLTDHASNNNEAA